MKLLKGFNKKRDTDLARPAAAQGLAQFRREINRAFEQAWRAMERDPWEWSDVMPFPAWPPIDLSEDDKALTLRVDVPGVNPDDVDVEVSGNQLTIRGRREEEQKEEDGGRYRHERYAGSFIRSITLPAEVNGDAIEAKYAGGVLEIRAPKVPGKEPKRIAVKAT